jgi:hypothetical protein
VVAHPTQDMGQPYGPPAHVSLADDPLLATPIAHPMARPSEVATPPGRYPRRAD